jgi:protein-S-isoprenylcysteine O-methyltransferase Ste14
MHTNFKKSESMKLIGKTTIHPVFFYSGKISGYLTWVALLLMLMNIDVVDKKSLEYNTITSISILLIGLVFVVWSMIIYHFIILGEEQFMENRFGSEYLEYKKKRRRYL